MEDNNTAIEVKNLTKIYKLYRKPIDRLKESLNPFKKKYHRDFFALKDINIIIKKGETVGIVGKNGSGKSTLLKIITGVLTPTKGSVKVYGKISAILELGAGFNPEMSGIENIYLNTAISKFDKKNLNSKIKEIVSFSELDDFINQPLKTYSSGMKARLGFAVAINTEPDILIVDEALAVGDVAFQRKCFAKIEQIRKNGATVLFVSHSETNIVNLCTRAIWLNNGEKIIEGKPKLVTGLYIKNSNKANIDKNKISKEFNELLKDNIKNKKKQVEKKINQKSTSIKEYFDATLKPKSTIIYEENGAKIENIYIKNQKNEVVNVLQQGEIYNYCYDVTYAKDYDNIRLGMAIKTKTGGVLVSGEYPFFRTKKGISVKKSKKYTIRWKFKCIFGEGNYFTNSGTFDLNEQIKLHRVVDAYMFKVVCTTRSVNAGTVSALEEAIIEANDCEE